MSSTVNATNYGSNRYIAFLWSLQTGNAKPVFNISKTKVSYDYKHKDLKIAAHPHLPSLFA